MHWVSTTTLLVLTQSLDTRRRVPALRQGPLKTRTAAEEDVSATGRVPEQTLSGVLNPGAGADIGKLFPQAPATAQTSARTEGMRRAPCCKEAPARLPTRTVRSMAHRIAKVVGTAAGALGLAGAVLALSASSDEPLNPAAEAVADLIHARTELRAERERHAAE